MSCSDNGENADPLLGSDGAAPRGVGFKVEASIVVDSDAGPFYQNSESRPEGRLHGAEDGDGHVDAVVLKNDSFLLVCSSDVLLQVIMVYSVSLTANRSISQVLWHSCVPLWCEVLFCS